MSKLYCGNAECGEYLGSMGADNCVYCGWVDQDAIESAATEPLLQRIAELEQNNRDLSNDVQSFRKHALNEKAARLELERQLEEARKDAERYRWLRAQDSDDFEFAVVKNPHFDVYGSQGELDAAIDAAMQKGQS